MTDYTAVLLDLDGTIIDSAPGILAAIIHTHEQMGRPAPPVDELMPWIGPPILESFRDLAGWDEEQSERALRIYRTFYAEHGMLGSAAFPGAIEAVRAIAEAGVPTSIATSKPESAARVILASLDLTDAFTEITGGSDDEARSTKAAVIEEALRRLDERGVDLSRVVHVGDRIHDVEGAAAHGIPTIFAGWGYGDPAEAEHALLTVQTPAELLEALGI
ncbi:HAD hydrolase-like protein [Salinibacterium sp. ZJ70]|uniref:HAD hydrolase-like protein n=1 Tax=Salinibacterium sp. ZJ70 TaxID=2708084 RepID=UPI00141F6C3A|nr:HAD hydrolase-like protein [Salinibacterium sp. ZJ70]